MNESHSPDLPEVIDTQRLRLRPVRTADAPAMFDSYTQDPKVSRYMTWRPHRSIDETTDFVRRCEREWDLGNMYTWAITRSRDDRLLGTIDLRTAGHRAEIGYALTRAEWGKGYMTEAARAVVESALARPGLYRVGAVCDVENPVSARVMEKAGMQREGVLRRYILHPNVSDEPRDVYIYARGR